MKLKNTEPLYRALVRAQVDPSVLVACAGDCPKHGQGSPFWRATEGDFAGQVACRSCVDIGKAAAAMGRLGGKVGGRSTSPAKVAAFKQAASKRWK